MTLAAAGDSGANWTSAGVPFVERVVSVDSRFGAAIRAARSPSQIARSRRACFDENRRCGTFGEPFGAWYHATKFAVEGLSDSNCIRSVSMSSLSSRERTQDPFRDRRVRTANGVDALRSFRPCLRCDVPTMRRSE
jgi:hypothetical protein